MRDRHKARASLFLKAAKALPKLMRVGRFAGADRVNARGSLCVQSGHDHAVQVHAIIRLGPFPPDHGRKDARLIMRVGRGNRPAPHVSADSVGYIFRNADKIADRDILHAAGDDRVCRVAGFNHMWRETADDSGQVSRLVNLVAQAAQREGGEPALPEPGFVHLGVLAEYFADDAERLRMISDDQKIKRALQLDPRPVERVDDRLTLGKAIGRIRVCGAVAGNKGICGIRRVQMRVTPEQLRVRGVNRCRKAGARKQGSGEKSGAHNIVPDHLYLSSSVIRATIRKNMA